MKHALTASDFRTDVWGRLTKTLRAELERLRESNDASSKDAVATALTRGQISAVKELLALAKASATEDARPDLPVEYITELHQLGIQTSGET